MTSTIHRTRRARWNGSVALPPDLDSPTDRDDSGARGGASSVPTPDGDADVIDLRDGAGAIAVLEHPVDHPAGPGAASHADDSSATADGPVALAAEPVLRPMAPNAAVTPGRVSAAMHIVLLAATCGVVAWHVAIRGGSLGAGRITIVYSLVVTAYVLSRFLLAAAYRPPRHAGLEPTVAVIVPAYNEGEAVIRTVHACAALDYPASKIEVVCVNDGSSDDTWEHMTAAAREHPDLVTCIDLGENQGKRAAMAAGIRATDAEILVFVDSDSVPAVDGVRRLVQGFADPKVGAVAGITHVRNAHRNALTRMQAARYFVSYELLKSAESVVGAVACCSGCFSAYRRSALEPLLERWEHQRFLGAECTYGDDRSLTNLVIKAGHTTRYDRTAEAWTDSPHTYRKFLRQQLRWKKSWIREGPLLLGHIWRTRTLAFPFVLVATIAGLLSPVVLLLNLGVVPAKLGIWPVVYLLGLYLVAVAYGVFYRSRRRDGLWLYAVMGTFFYIAISVQMLWAVVRVRDGSWGTRGG